MNNVIAYVRTFTDACILNVFLVITNSPVLLATLSTIFYAIARAYLVYKDQRAINRFLKSQIDMNDIMRIATQNSVIDRIMFFEADEIPMEQNPLKRLWSKLVDTDLELRYVVSATNEQHKPNFWGEKHLYQDLHVDTEYCEMLKKVKKNGSYFIDVSKMKDSALKAIYQKREIKYSRVYRIYHRSRKRKFYFMSVATYEADFRKEFKTENQLNMSVNQIRDIYKSIYSF
ncbi:MAG: hypothetical protein NXI00_10885 [Cytophagales bacterium]|nr:hypothetical protein [Cytophagales bacterium]